jgi:SAM-dependent methyltransferase
LHRNVIEECEARLGNPRLRFVLIDDLDKSGSFDQIFCMEVLEHVVELQRAVDCLEPLLTPEGKLFISVPVETGLPLILKQTVRRIAGWWGVGDYPGQSSYSIGEYLAAILAGSRQRIVRPITRDENKVSFPDHKGFNWMAFRATLAQRFEIEEVVSSPITWLSPHLATQVWLVVGRSPMARFVDRGHRILVFR